MSGVRGLSSASASPSTVSSGRGSSEGSWWRWTQGHRSTSSSSTATTSPSTSASLSSSSSPSADSSLTTATRMAGKEAWESVRWGNRPTRSEHEMTASSSFLLSPKATAVFTTSASTHWGKSSARSGAAAARKRTTQASPHLHLQRATARSSGLDKMGDAMVSGVRSSRSISETTTMREGKGLQVVGQEERPFLATSTATWTTATTSSSTVVSNTKRKFGRKDKRSLRTPSPHPRGKTPDRRMSDVSKFRGEQRKSAFVSVDDVVMEAAEPLPSVHPTTARPTATSVSSLGFGNPDPLVTCARAVLQDCLRQRCLDSSNARKRTLEGCSKCDAGTDAMYGTGFSSKPYEFGSLSGCSSSSDDELSQLSSLEFAQTCADKNDCKTNSEELYRQLMLCDYSLSTSPDFECFSPLFEEKGLPVEIRYQLPLALGTANETDKECTICQLRYGIGDHIVTLPCQHFFHACCVDKWLWNHTSCPLCRTEVSLEPNVSETTASKHRFTECPQLDQETMRRKMRSSSHSVGFRPVIPAKLEDDQLDLDLTNLAIDEDDTETNSLTYLVCPKPQRSQPKQSH